MNEFWKHSRVPGSVISLVMIVFRRSMMNSSRQWRLSMRVNRFQHSRCFLLSLPVWS